MLLTCSAPTTELPASLLAGAWPAETRSKNVSPFAALAWRLRVMDNSLTMQQPQNELQVSKDVRSSAVGASPLYADLLADIYSVRDPSRVQGFLELHPSLAGLLLEAFPQIRGVFGRESAPVLEVLSDPESPSDDRLFVLVGTSSPVEEALGRLARLDETWWLRAMGRAESVLSIDVEFL